MNFEKYQKDQYWLYQSFALVVAGILEAALKTEVDTFHLWEIQKRAKDANSLRQKLLDRELLDHQNIENEIKDLAGCRLIFYSNDDVNKFIKSTIVKENFDVDWDESRIHQPVDENNDPVNLYRAHHYLVSLKEDRIKLPEYSRFLNLKCEIQIQTILNHAWSETGHDVIYKPLKTVGFGTRQHNEIKARMANIMQKYLLPAGYEFQKVLHDFERLSEGKNLFDRDVLQAIKSGADNNERYEIIERFRDFVLPGYDDLPGVFQEVLQIATSTIKFAHEIEPKPISTPFGDYPGNKSEDVTNIALDVIESIRYIDVQAIFSNLCEIYLSSKSDKERELVTKVIKKLAKHNMSVWEQIGPAIQTLLVQQLSGFTNDQLNNLSPVVVEVCKEILKPEIEGTTSTYNAVTIHTGSVVVSDELKKTRLSAIKTLQRIYKKSNQEVEKLNLIVAMSNAMRSPIRGSPSDEMLIMFLEDARSIYEFYQSLLKMEQYEILQRLEHDALWTYRRFKDLVNNDKFRSCVQEAAGRLIVTIKQFRDSMNEEENFVRFKVLVGFESVFLDSWEQSSNFDLEVNEAFRSQKFSEYVESITTENTNEWFAFLKLCSKIKSNDLATFLPFTQFLEQLSEKKPDIAIKYINALDDDLAVFLAAFLGGLWKSERKSEVKIIIDGWVKKRRYLNAIARHYRVEGVYDQEQLKDVLEAAIEVNNVVPAIKLVSVCIEYHDEANSTVLIGIFLDAIKFLTEKNDARWARENWFRVRNSTIFGVLNEDQVKIILSNLVHCPSVEYHTEEVLSVIAKNYPELIIQYFNERIQFEIKNPNENRYEQPYLDRYEDIPYKLDSLSEALSVIPETAIQIVQAWYTQSSELFTFRGGKLLAIIFPFFPEGFQSAIIAIIQTKNLDDIDFVISILRNYEGEIFTHGVCKEIIIALSEDDLSRQNEIEVILGERKDSFVNE